MNTQIGTTHFKKKCIEYFNARGETIMAKARTVTVTGKANWAKVFEQNRDMKGYNDSYVACDGACTIDMYLENEELATLKAAGSMARGSLTDEGVKVKLKRKFKGPFEEASGAPKVFKADGTPWNYDEDGTIGNGSTVEATVSVYDIKSFDTVGTRLESVKVINHVEYKPEPEEPTAPTSGDVTV